MPVVNVARGAKYFRVRRKIRVRTVKVEGELARKIMADIKKESRQGILAQPKRRNSSSCKTKVRVRVSAIIVLAAWQGIFLLPLTIKRNETTHQESALFPFSNMQRAATRGTHLSLFPISLSVETIYNTKSQSHSLLFVCIINDLRNVRLAASHLATGAASIPSLDKYLLMVKDASCG